MITKNTFDYYIRNRCSVIPLQLIWNEKDNKFDKKPLCNWREYQDRLPTEEEVSKWLQNPKLNALAMITGKISDIVVVDVDDITLLNKYDLQSPVIVETISGGRHFYYKWTEDIHNTAKIDSEDLDFRGDGGLVVVPPSAYKDNQYTNIGNMKLEDGKMFLSPLPKWFKDKLGKNDTTTKKINTNVSRFEAISTIIDDKWSPDNVMEGGRNNTLAGYCGYILQGMKGLNPSMRSKMGLIEVLDWNSKIPNPLSENEVITTFKSIFNADLRNNPQNATIEQKEEIVESLAEKFKRSVKNIKTIKETPIPDDIWLVDGLIPRGCTFLSGPPKSYKSFSSLHLFECLAEKKPLFGKFTVSKARKILVMDRENQDWNTNLRFGMVCPDLDVNNGNISYLTIGDSLADENNRNAYLEVIRDYDVIVFDSFRRYYTGNENDSEPMAKFFSFFDQIKEMGKSVIAIHHFNKNTDAKGSSRLRGSSDIIAYFDSNLNIEKNNSYSTTTIEVTQTENRMAKEMSPFQVGVIEGEDGSIEFKFIDFVDSQVSATDKLKLEIIDYLRVNKGKWFSSSEISKHFKSSHKDSVGTCLRKATDDFKLIRRFIEGKKNKGFEYTFGTELLNNQQKIER